MLRSDYLLTENGLESPLFSNGGSVTRPLKRDGLAGRATAPIKH